MVERYRRKIIRRACAIVVLALLAIGVGYAIAKNIIDIWR